MEIFGKKWKFLEKLEKNGNFLKRNEYFKFLLKKQKRNKSWNFSKKESKNLDKKIKNDKIKVFI